MISEIYKINLGNGQIFKVFDFTNRIILFFASIYNAILHEASPRIVKVKIKVSDYFRKKRILYLVLMVSIGMDRL